jgi:hypothetical protein
MKSRYFSRLARSARKPVAQSMGGPQAVSKMSPDMMKLQASKPSLQDQRAQYDKNMQQPTAKALANALAAKPLAKAIGSKPITTTVGKPPVSSKFRGLLSQAKKLGLGMKKGGKVSSASKRADGCCVRGKTKA